MRSSTSLADELDRLYTDPSRSGALSGIDRLYRAAKREGLPVTRERVKDYLARKRSYTLHRLQPKRFNRRKTVARAPNIIAQSDLADLSLLSRHNDGIKYLLVVIDVFSRFLAVRGIRRKDGASVARALEEILSESFRSISRLQTDRGGEYYNRTVSRLLDERKIVLYSTYSQETKAALAERVIQTLKRRIYRYLTENNTQRYIDILPDLVRGYNHTRHSSLMATPVDIHSLEKNSARVRELFNHLYKTGNTKTKSLQALNVGDTVRITLESRDGVFAKGYRTVNSEELFKIHRIDKSQRPIVYFLVDLTGEVLTGAFYREELIRVKLPELVKQRGGKMQKKGRARQPLIVQCKELIFFLNQLSPSQRASVIQTLKHKHLASLAEVFSNFLQSNLPASKPTIKRLRRYRDAIQKVARKSTKVSEKRNILRSRRGGAILSALLPLAATFLSKLLM